MSAMYSPGHQHHHGVTKNIVEGIGGVIIGAAAVLLLARVFKNKRAKALAAPATPAAPEEARVPVRKARTRKAPPAEAVAAAASSPTDTKPASKRRSRAKAVTQPTAIPEPAES
jgi:hypothetical protein